ncbi:hypothetical protein [uncultured Methanobrevibacter sp.]|uniref:hypothetical protein n=1 Tax=uncultured Methanobrevibacter sp. TaxID=253161 RepID=UPI0025FC0325|nr:hypothetical protein [uncultured Methanobrevibacter sp.]
MHSFVDTNVSIGFMFSIDPLNNKSMSVFGEYEYIFWSNCVKDESEKVFKNKRKILIEFFKDLSNNLKPEDFQNFTYDDLKKYIYRNYSKNKKRNQILSSLGKFWSNYVDEMFPTYDSFINSVNNCLSDLKISVYSRKNEWESTVLLSELRTEMYIEIKNKLNSFKVHSPDDKIILDAHDHNLRNEFLLDFITFDKDCCDAASRIEDFSFNKVKGISDYL